MKSFSERKWVQELGILVFSFILFTLNDWILITSWRGFFLGIVYFMLLYGHAQLNRYLLLPILVKKHNAFVYISLTLVLLVVSAFILSHLTKTFLYKNCYLYQNTDKLTYHFQFGVLLGACICILGTAQFLEYYRRQKDVAYREILSNKNQIDLLNKQLNPHFLFNTLNTIYGLSIKFPKKTPEVIMKVSEMLRYQIENSNKNLVSLKDEISFIRSYIELEEERVGYRCRIEFDDHIDEPEKFYIAPMIIFTFVENAFKHGASNIESCFVKIDLSLKSGVLTLQMQNSIPIKNNRLPSTKVGLENTKARLKMIYPEKHKLEIGTLHARFNTFLEITL
ncbi:sensor histidine kinase [Pontibacter harenae]|uniref:sensor histidine kinase n=1 Tax=Pontibacter harenae TaxID=2894083 RepID=UPI001E3DA592|nr:histidine kinase [Pontibacter harenae]MCC9167731.1 histidine kinase [Pontibacter harenae]